MVSVSEPSFLAETLRRGITPHRNGCVIQGAAHIRAEVRFHHASHSSEVTPARYCSLDAGRGIDPGWVYGKHVRHKPTSHRQMRPDMEPSIDIPF